MKISILTLFPGMFSGPFSHSIIKRAVEDKKIEIEYKDIRDFGIGKHKMVDDTPYGGGVGMLLRVDVLENALTSLKCSDKTCRERIVLLDAGGKTFTQQKAEKLSQYDHLIFIAAHYEGVDERIRAYIDDEISIGDYVLTGGEIPTMVLVDSIVRLIPGVLGKDESAMTESFQQQNNQLLEYPQYTKPAVYKTHTVPDVLVSGHHKKIAAWREEKAKERTKKNRPDLLAKRRS